MALHLSGMGSTARAINHSTNYSALTITNIFHVFNVSTKLAQSSVFGFFKFHPIRAKLFGPDSKKKKKGFEKILQFLRIYLFSVAERC